MLFPCDWFGSLFVLHPFIYSLLSLLPVNFSQGFFCMCPMIVLWFRNCFLMSFLLLNLVGILAGRWRVEKLWWWVSFFKSFWPDLLSQLIFVSFPNRGTRTRCVMATMVGQCRPARRPVANSVAGNRNGDNEWCGGVQVVPQINPLKLGHLFRFVSPSKSNSQASNQAIWVPYSRMGIRTAAATVAAPHPFFFTTPEVTQPACSLALHHTSTSCLTTNGRWSWPKHGSLSCDLL